MSPAESSSRAEVEEEWSRRLRPRTDESRSLEYWAGHSGTHFIGWWGLGVPAGEPDAGELLARDADETGLALYPALLPFSTGRKRELMNRE